MKLSEKAMGISPSLTLAITAKAKQMKQDGRNVIGFGAGEPDFDTPDHIKTAGIEAINTGKTRYTAASGILELKKAIAEKLKSDNGITYRTDQIIVCSGAKQALANVFLSILNKGDEVLISAPYWVTYPELVKMGDGVPVIVDTDERDGFKFTIEKLQSYVTEKTKAIIINSPSNPTGAVYSREELEKIAEFCRANDLIIISDEIYEKLIYGNKKHVSIASLSEDAYKRTVVINGVSKAYAMTGWRIGYAAGCKEIISLMSSIQSHTTSNPCSVSQYAALEALSGDQSQVGVMKAEFEKRRNYMAERINSIDGLSCRMPEGAFYIMMNISKMINKCYNGNMIKDSMDFSKFLLEEKEVAVVPGIAFGVDNYVRLSYATSMENIKEGLDRIEAFVKSI